MKVKDPVAYDVRGWYDLEGARLLNAQRNRNAIYLCEQAAEKIIRAVSTSEKIHAGISTNLQR